MREPPSLTHTAAPLSSRVLLQLRAACTHAFAEAEALRDEVCEGESAGNTAILRRVVGGSGGDGDGDGGRGDKDRGDKDKATQYLPAMSDCSVEDLKVAVEKSMGEVIRLSKRDVTASIIGAPVALEAVRKETRSLSGLAKECAKGMNVKYEGLLFAAQVW